MRRAPPRTGVFPRARALAALKREARAVATCFLGASALPRLHVRMAVAPNGRVSSVRLGRTAGVKPSALSCAKEKLGAVRFGPLPIDRMETVVWALDLTDLPPR